MEPIYRQTFTLSDMEVDCFGRLKLSALLYFAQEVAGRHSELLGAGYDDLAQKGIFWAVTRHRVQISRLPCRVAALTRILPAALVNPVLTPSAPSTCHRSLLWLRRCRSPALAVLAETVL